MYFERPLYRTTIWLVDSYQLSMIHVPKERARAAFYSSLGYKNKG